ncbi:helix-turn-helix DNA binding protein [Mycobacterium phage Kimona]|uniref:Helix-turn-helix DNA binding protein n=1 Tax=Mycobacterium phage Kimona TaxID=2024295 RepID=A0A249XU44_9CAUD|nr:helix-turn-helix DNA binding protein [Mycobacterium phage Kimona]ASZ75500.1 helix-turn-helix DNA binding protein [Mycobacterium phage Kimona]
MKWLLLKILSLYWTSDRKEAMDELNLNAGNPDKPREWNPNHPQLKSPLAPHETGAVLRAHRAGFSGYWITRTFRMSPAEVMSSIRRQITAENDAHRRGVAIYDGQKAGRRK